MAQFAKGDADLKLPSEATSQFLASLLRNIPGDVYRCRNDRDWTMEYVSEGVRDLTGYAAADFLSGRVKFGDLMHPEDRERVWATAQSALAARLPYTLEYRIRTADGSEKWVWERGSGVFAPDGSVQALEGFVGDVTERKHAEEALRESEARFRNLSELSSDWYWEQDAELRFVPTSGLEGRRDGLSPNAYIGLRRWEVPGSEIVGQSWEAHKAVLAARKPFRDLMLRRTFTDRADRYVNIAGEPIYDRKGTFTGYRGIGRDVTERVIAERQARTADERLRVAIEYLGESIAIVDAEDRIVLANRHFRELNGNTSLVDPGHLYEEHLRAGMALGNYPQSAGREDQWLAQRLERHRAGGRIEVKRQNGKWLQVTDQRLPDGGMITFALDITDLKRAEEALRDINADLERRVAARTAELEATNRELEAFSYAVSHDLRAPLRAVSGFAKILLKNEGPGLSAEAQRYLGIIDANGRRMGTLIDALLALGRHARVALNKAEVDMTHLAREACDELGPSTPRAQIVVLPLPPALGNATLLKQVFLNLVGNALKYSANVPEPRIEIRAESGGYVVSDNGAGFDMAYAGKLFKPFERLHTGPEFEGTGIGLAIVKQIVERHGGTVQAQGAPGAGATFSFSLARVA